MTEEQRRHLERKLWDIADEFRGRMDADEFRNYILGFIFYKYLSERLRIHADRILAADDLGFLALDENGAVDRGILGAVEEDCLEALGYFLRPGQLFARLARRGRDLNAFILDDLAAILMGIQQSTTGTDSDVNFDNLFEYLDLNSTKLGRTPQARNDLIAKVLWHLDEIDFELEDTNSDVLGDAYEYLIGTFTSGAGKKAGEFYTPQQVSTIMARIVAGSKTRLRSVYDPACGSGSLLLRVSREVEVEVEEVGGFFGQEMNRTTYNLARMNMILHGVHYSRFDIRQDDTLLHPQHLGHDKFEAVVANPPFSAKWSAGAHLEADNRFSEYGRLAPKSKADFAFVQHMLFHLAEDGGVAARPAGAGASERGRGGAGGEEGADRPGPAASRPDLRGGAVGRGSLTRRSRHASDRTVRAAPRTRRATSGERKMA
jgi:type I restriction enzyme M protein